MLSDYTNFNVIQLKEEYMGKIDSRPGSAGAAELDAGQAGAAATSPVPFPSPVPSPSPDTTTDSIGEQQQGHGQAPIQKPEQVKSIDTVAATTLVAASGESSHHLKFVLAVGDPKKGDTIGNVPPKTELSLEDNREHPPLEVGPGYRFANIPQCAVEYAKSRGQNGNLNNANGVIVFALFTERPVEDLYFVCDLTGWQNFIRMSWGEVDGKRCAFIALKMDVFAITTWGFLEYKFVVKHNDGRLEWFADPNSVGHGEFGNSRCYPYMRLKYGMDVKMPEDVVSTLKACKIACRYTHLVGMRDGIFDMSNVDRRTDIGKGLDPVVLLAKERRGDKLSTQEKQALTLHSALLKRGLFGGELTLEEKQAVADRDAAEAKRAGSDGDETVLGVKIEDIYHDPRVSSCIPFVSRAEVEQAGSVPDARSCKM
jgi:hypothetical protein